LLAALPLFAQKKADQLYEVSATKYMLGTQIDLKAMHPDILGCKKAFYDAYQEIARIEALLSSHIASSEVTKINKMAGVKPVKVSYETFAIISRSVQYSKKFKGIFDASIGPVTTLWGFSDDKKDITLPKRSVLEADLKLVDYRRVALSKADTTVFLERKGMRLDLGGIAKGYAIDRAAYILKNKGIQHFLINAGGDIYACGYKYGEKKWLVGIQHPRRQADLLATFEVHDMAVATSGDYERYKIIDGKRYHHIIDPRTGFPATLDQSVTVFANSAEEADAWATYLFIIGYENEQKSALKPELGTVFVDASGNVEYDHSLEDAFNLRFVGDKNHAIQ